MTQTQQATHTPGPWAVDDATGMNIICLKPRHTLFVGQPTACARANARLIAAAPETAVERDRLKQLNAELVAALKLYLAYGAAQMHHLQTGTAACRAYDAANAAIAKSEGR